MSKSRKILFEQKIKQETCLYMKSIKEILGDIQQVFSFDSDYRLVFDEEPIGYLQKFWIGKHVHDTMIPAYVSPVLLWPYGTRKRVESE